MTLYVSYIRAWSLSNVNNALKCQNKTRYKVLIELGVYTTAIVIPECLIEGLALFVFQAGLDSLHISFSRGLLSFWALCGY